jgi:hypothetical protein
VLPAAIFEPFEQYGQRVRAIDLDCGKRNTSTRAQAIPAALIFVLFLILAGNPRELPGQLLGRLPGSLTPEY